MDSYRKGQLVGLSFILSAVFLVIVSQTVSYISTLMCTIVLLVGLCIISGLYVVIVKEVLISCVLGVLFGVGAIVAVTSNSSWNVGCYAMLLTLFHISEYIMTSIYNPHTLSLDSFLINHSREYAMAAILSWIEYVVEWYYCPFLSLWPVSVVGLLISLSGEALRKAAMVTAGSNFTHNIQYYKRSDHVLVTSGIYGWFRHPSYVGWFYWSIGTQLVLCNPVCLVGYALASWHFFYERIETEEELLVHFFGEDYLDYQKNVGIGIPLIKGFIPHH